jgi:hypothetical protein
MANVYFDVNMQASVDLVRKLGEVNRSAFPVAIRQTLNQAAFDVKQNSLELSATNNFIRRSPNFFKRFSGVNRAAGFDVNRMKAEVGMTDMSQVTAQAAISHMNQQEFGGGVTGGADYLKASRAGNNNRRVSKANYLSKSNVLHGPFKRKGTTKSNFIASAYAALATGKLMKFKSASGITFYSKVTSMSSISRGKKRGQVKIVSKLMIERRNSVSIKATHFMKEAAMLTYAKMPDFFNRQAEKQIMKALK